MHVTAAMVKSFADLQQQPGDRRPDERGDRHRRQRRHALRPRTALVHRHSRRGAGCCRPAAPTREFEGVQAWPEATWAYRPGDPAGGAFGDYGFPRLPDLLRQASTRAGGVGRPAGALVRRLRQPRHAAAGHVRHQLAAAGAGRRRPEVRSPSTPPPSAALTGYAATGSVAAAGGGCGRRCSPDCRSGFRERHADPARFLFEQRDFMAEHFRTQPTPGPVGHGFTQHNLDTGRDLVEGRPEPARPRLRPGHLQPGRRARTAPCPTTSSGGWRASWPAPRPSSGWC